MEKNISVFSPFVVGNNLYIENTKKIIEKSGIKLISLKECLRSPKLFYRSKSINFNWYEQSSSLIEYLKRTIVLYMFYITRKKIIYTIHNKTPHRDKDRKYSQKLTKKLIKKSNTIIGLCDETYKVVESIDINAISKIVIIPMPNYISCYQYPNTRDFREEFEIQQDTIVFTYFGNISPYKNVELLIDAFLESKVDAVLLIVGKPFSEEYRAELEKKTDNNKIKCIYEFIPDDMVRSVFECSDVMIMPYDKTSSMNASAIILSYSMKKTVVSPQIGTITSQKETDFVYAYDYCSEGDHKEKLIKMIRNVCLEHDTDKDVFIRKGNQAFEYVKKYHNQDRITELYSKVYK